MPQKPRRYTEALGARIAQEYAGGKSLSKICASTTMPAASTVRRWLSDERYAVFHGQFGRARAALADHLVDEIIAIADSDDPQKARVRIDARKWAAARLAPQLYGDKLQHTGEGGGAIETKDLGAGDIARRIAFLLESARRQKSSATGAKGDAQS